MKLRAAPQIPAEIERLLAVRVDGQLPDWAASEAVDQFAALSSDARRALAPWFQEQVPAMPKDKQSRGEVEALLAIAHPYAVDVDEAARVTVDASCPLAIKKSHRARNLAVDRILAGTPADLRHRWLEDLAPNRRE